MSKITKRKFRKSDWDTAAEFIHQEKERRAQSPKRKEVERQWKEVDRQVAMIPKAKAKGSPAWIPDIELPLQASALEVITADVRRLRYPRSSEWYMPHSDVTDKVSSQINPTLKGEFEQADKIIDQELADILVRSVMDHYHGLFNFRNQVAFMDTEAIKYGTYACRVSKVLLPQFGSGENIYGPAVIPISIKNLYLDDSPQQVMQEGIVIAPAPIRFGLQTLSDAQMAAKTGGAKNGWIAENLKDLEPFGDESEKRGHIELLEWGGDLVFPRKTSENIYLPNVTVTVAVGNNGPKVIRFRENPQDTRQNVFGTYMSEGDSIYGSSPLMKGQPLQEAATEIYNRLVAVGILSAEPPISWDPNDGRMTGMNGPVIEPAAIWASDNPQGIIVHKIGELSDLLQVYLALLQQYEDLTGVNAPRRGAQAKSHTTAFAAGIESEKGLIRTADFVQSSELGSTTDILNLEYAIARQTIGKKGVSVFVRELNRFVLVKKDDLPETVTFDVMGSSGPASVQEQNQNVVNAFQMAAQLSGLSQQMGGPVLNAGEAMKEILKNGQIPNPERFITQAPKPPQGTPQGQGPNGSLPGVPGESL